MALLVAPALLVAIPLAACTSSSDCSECEAERDALKDTIAHLQNESTAFENDRDALESALAAAEAERDALRAELEESQSRYIDAAGRLEELQTAHENLLADLQSSDLRNPSWEDLKRFLKEDRTDALQYKPGEFDCEGFAINLRDAAARRGFRSAFVAIGFGEGTVGHALNAFQTTDRGLIYVDVTERDSIAYVEKGKPYGTIVLEGVKATYIDCSVRPEAFWKQPLGYKQYGGSLFAYAYYEDYSARWAFCDASISAYNAEVQSYNTAVEAFNWGMGSYSYAQLTAWSDRLEAWSENLSALQADLGGVQIASLGTVDTIETYWN